MKNTFYNIVAVITFLQSKDVNKGFSRVLEVDHFHVFAFFYFRNNLFDIFDECFL